MALGYASGTIFGAKPGFTLPPGPAQPPLTVMGAGGGRCDASSVPPYLCTPRQPGEGARRAPLALPPGRSEKGRRRDGRVPAARGRRPIATARGSAEAAPLGAGSRKPPRRAALPGVRGGEATPLPPAPRGESPLTHPPRPASRLGGRRASPCGACAAAAAEL